MYIKRIDRKPLYLGVITSSWSRHGTWSWKGEIYSTMELKKERKAGNCFQWQCFVSVVFRNNLATRLLFFAIENMNCQKIGSTKADVVHYIRIALMGIMFSAFSFLFISYDIHLRGRIIYSRWELRCKLRSFSTSTSYANLLRQYASKFHWLISFKRIP